MPLFDAALLSCAVLTGLATAPNAETPPNSAESAAVDKAPSSDAPAQNTGATAPPEKAPEAGATGPAGEETAGQTPPSGSDPAAPGGPAPQPDPGLEATPDPAVSDEAWNALVERDVVIETASGEVQGKLLSVGEQEVVVADPSGRITTVRKTDATGLRIGPSQPEPEPEPEPQPQSQPPPAYSPPPPAQSEPPPPKPDKPFALLGLYTAHGGGYAHWSGDDKEGTGAYAFDVGLGINFSERFGLYALGGGLVGGKIFDKAVKANYFHLAPMIAFRGKYFGSMFGIGGAFSSLKASSGEHFKDAGLAVPTKIFGIIPLKKNLYIGIGLGYDFAAVNKFDIFFHGITGQVAVGRW